MSASKDKRIRKEQIEAGTDKRTAAKAKEAAQRRKSNIIYAVVAVLVVLFVAFVLFYNSTFMVRHTTAATIDGQDYTAAQMNYYYSTAYMTFYNNYSQYISMFFDPDESLADQEYADGTSWRDYFLDSAAQNMANIQMLVTEAEAAGFTMSEEQEADYEAEVESLETAWEDLGYTNLQQYLNLNFGKGVDFDLVKQELYRSHLAAAYSDSQYNSYEYSDQELDDYYAEHADELDVIDYAYYIVPKPAEETEDTATDTAEPVEDAEEAEEDTEDTEEPAEETDAEEPAEETLVTSAEAKAIAEAVDGTDQETFTEYLAEDQNGAEPTVQSMPGSSISGDYSEWLLDEAREPGDATAIDTATSSYVVMFLDRNTNDYPTVSFRHILIQAEDADGDGSFSDEEIQTAADEAQDIYDEWKAGDATEDSFADLANERSTDGGSNTNGGLYENVYKGAMVDPIDQWIFDEDRKPGDTTVVSFDGSYTGTHVVYFVGTADMTYARAQADNALRSDAYSTWNEEKMADYEPVTSHLSMCGKNH